MFQTGQAKENMSYDAYLTLTCISIVPSNCQARLRSIKVIIYERFLASRTTHRRAIRLENRVLPYCVVFPTMINSHVRFIVVAFIPGARAREEKKKREKEILSQYISHDYSRVYSMEIGITYLYPYDDDGNSNDSIFLPRRQGARGYIHTGQLLHMTNRRLLPFNLFARLHLHAIVSPVALYIRPRPSVDILNTRNFFFSYDGRACVTVRANQVDKECDNMRQITRRVYEHRFQYKI